MSYPRDADGLDLDGGSLRNPGKVGAPPSPWDVKRYGLGLEPKERARVEEAAPEGAYPLAQGEYAHDYLGAVAPFRRRRDLCAESPARKFARVWGEA